MREYLGMMQKEMAEVFDITASAYHSIEKGDKSTLRLKHVLTLYHKYKINPNWLILGDGNMFLERIRENQIEDGPFVLKEKIEGEFDVIRARIALLEAQIVQEMQEKYGKKEDDD